MLIRQYLYSLSITLLLFLSVIVFQELEIFDISAFLRGKDRPYDNKKEGTMKKILLVLSAILFVIGALRRMIQQPHAPCLWIYMLALGSIGDWKRIETGSVAYKIIQMPNKEVFDA